MNRILVFVIILICIVFAVSAFFKIYEKFINSNIEFVSKEYFIDICKQSSFFQRMNQFDMIARNQSPDNLDNYLNIYISSIESFTEQEKMKLTKLCQEADRLASKYHYFNNIPWKFVKIANHIENGYPHTLGDVIVLTDKILNVDNIISILLHEKMHVFQRKRPDVIDHLIQLWGMYKTKYIHPRERNNPDLNEYAYGLKPNIIFKQIYNNDHPSSLLDSSVYEINTSDHQEKPSDFKIDSVHQMEHPYEISACMFAHILYHKKENYNSFEQQLFNWANTYLV